MILGAGGGSGGSPIRGIQADLAKIGMPVRITGRLDAPTVDGINQVLGSWDDAPLILRKKLSMHDIAQNIGLVRTTLHKAVGGAMSVAAG